ncbi:hypothetical protein TNCV_487881 [Trichonephila clavipes]|nr:hypothetical protein TNCV_487881 [Trichonephila clavipes]
MLCLKQLRAFAEKTCFSNDRSVIGRAFRRHFDIPPLAHVPDRKCVLKWNDAFRATRSVSKERKEPPKTVRIHKNVEQVRMSIQTGMRQ